MPALLNALWPALIAAFIVWAVAFFLTLIDIYNAHRGRQQRKTVYAWYARPLLWFARIQPADGGTLRVYSQDDWPATA